MEASEGRRMGNVEPRTMSDSKVYIPTAFIHQIFIMHQLLPMYGFASDCLDTLYEDRSPQI